MKQKVTLQHIADVLGVSRVTVFRALKGQDGVGFELRKTIEKKAADFGYVPVYKNSRAFHFSFVISSRFFLKSETFYTDIYYHLNRLCDHKRHRLSLHIIDTDMEDQLILPNTLLHPTPTGVFIIGEFSRKYLKELQTLTVPSIGIDFYSPIPSFLHVTVDNYTLGYKAAWYLIDRGHKEVGFIGREDISSNVADRISGMRKALAENGYAFRREWIVKNNDSRTGLYSLDFDLPSPLPSAFICHCDRAAYFLMEKLRTRNISVPQDISIISFDDTKVALETSPQLTCIHIERKTFAEKAFELMEKKLEEPHFTLERVYLPARIVERESVRRLSCPLSTAGDDVAESSDPAPEKEQV